MPSISVMGFFCEDIREEKNESYTLVGLMPDNADAIGDDLPGQQKILPKVCMFLRINFDPQNPIANTSVHMVWPHGARQKLGIIDANVVQNASSQAIHKGNPVAGVIFRAIMGGLALSRSGVYRLEVDTAGETYLAAALNVNIVPSVSTASALPASQ